MNSGSTVTMILTIGSVIWVGRLSRIGGCWPRQVLPGISRGLAGCQKRLQRLQQMLQGERHQTRRELTIFCFAQRWAG
jgi:hypothetical protein